MTATSTPLVARRSDHTDTYHGTTVADPYRWMEDLDAPELRSWLEAQNTAARTLLDPVPGRDALRQRLLDLTNFERVSTPTTRNGRFLYAHNSGLQNQAVLFWQQGLTGEPHLLLDPNTLIPTGKAEPDGTVALQSTALSPDGSLLAYALAEAGSDWVTWHVRQLSDATDLPDTISWSKFSSASWLPDNSGFVYAGYGPQPTTDAAAPGQDSASFRQTNHFHKLFLHRLGTHQGDDITLYERPDDPELLVSGHLSDDGRFLLIAASKGHTNQLFAFDLSLTTQATTLSDADRLLAAVSSTPLLPIAPTADARYDPIDTDGDLLWLHTTSGAPLGRVVTLSLAGPTAPGQPGSSDQTTWRTILPESQHNLDAVTLVGNTLIATHLVDAQSEVTLLDPHTGDLRRTLPLPAIGTVGPFTGRRSDPETFVTFTNFTTPPTVLHLPLANADAAPSPWRAPRLNFDPSTFTTTQLFSTSRDGTRVPMFVSHRAGLPLDGTNPTLLYGYGGFNIPLLPAFSPTFLLWMELGGVFAQANLRGGGEYGETWHEAGTRVRKQNVFDDFISCAEHLITARYTTPRRLAIEGGSNGGLLVAAVSQQRPELFAAVLAHVGVMDMLRFPEFTIGYAWKSDYGDPAGNPDEFRALLRYSPLHNARPGIAYPPTLVLTGDHDDRVFPAHSFKYTAAMQHALAENAASDAADLLAVLPPDLTPAEAAREISPDPSNPSTTPVTSTEASQKSVISTEAKRSGETPVFLPSNSNPAFTGGPILLRVDLRAGHGAGKPLSKRIDEVVDVYSFLAHFLRHPLP